MVGRVGFEPTTIGLKVAPEVAGRSVTQTKADKQQLDTKY